MSDRVSQNSSAARRSSKSSTPCSPGRLRGRCRSCVRGKWHARSPLSCREGATRLEPSDTPRDCRPGSHAGLI